MATKYHNLSEYNPNEMPDGSDMRIGIAVAEWNNQITEALLAGALRTLARNGVKKENIMVEHVPGSFELIYASAQMAQCGFDAIIAIGCVIRGDTPHFDYICQGTTAAIADLNARQSTPIIYGLITTNNLEQALDRSGGKLGNKGDECAVTAMKMVALRRKLNHTEPSND